MRKTSLAVVVMIAMALAGCAQTSTPTAALGTPSASPSATATPHVVHPTLKRVPNVDGESRARASARLRADGFALVASSRTVTHGLDGVILAEYPVGGTPEAAGTRIRVVISKLVTPPPPPPTQQAVPPPQSCTTTSSGTCIRGGEFCRQDEYGTTGYDAEGRAYTCTGDATHPHWELP